MVVIMNNPPAFPTNQYANGISPSGFDTGMTLRDYFAAKAMQELMTYKDRPIYLRPVDEVAIDAYEMADAMLEAREA
jgi:hypothetical protein